MSEQGSVHDIVVNYVKERKNVANVNVSITERKGGVWIIRGTCPIDIGGHSWRESFEVIVDQKGKVKASSFKLI